MVTWATIASGKRPGEIVHALISKTNAPRAPSRPRVAGWGDLSSARCQGRCKTGAKEIAGSYELINLAPAAKPCSWLQCGFVAIPTQPACVWNFVSFLLYFCLVGSDKLVAGHVSRERELYRIPRGKERWAQRLAETSLTTSERRCKLCTKPLALGVARDMQCSVLL